ncbi:MAG: TolC family protein [Elusimicrobiota bacterium]|nr:TolC family protein [Elusimicrobiota bacterium]
MSVFAFLVLLPLAAAAQAPSSALPERVYSLDEALRLTRNDPKLQSAEQDVIIAEQRVKEAKFQFLPEVGLQASATKYDARYPFALSEDFRSILLFPSTQENIFSGRGYMRMSLYEGQRGMNTLRLARAAYQQALSNRDSVRLDLALQVKEAFYRLLYAQEAARGADELAAAVERASGEDGLGVWERIEAEAALGAAASRASDARHQLDAARLTFLRTLNLELDTPFKVDGRLETKPFKAEVEKAVVWAMELRPELQSQTYKAQMDAISVNLALGRRYPTLYVAGDYELTDQRFPLKKNNWDVTVGLKVPFSYDYWTQIARKKAEQRQGQLVRAELQDRVRLEVRQAAENLRYWQEEWPRREARWTRVSGLFEAGAGRPGPALSKIRARQGLLELRLAHLAAVKEHILARARLERAVGRELQP